MRGRGYWPLFVLALGSGLPFIFVNDRGLAEGLSTALAAVALPLALRAGMLRADARFGPPLAGSRLKVRTFLLRRRWPVAVAWGLVAASGYERFGSRVWLTTLAFAAAFTSAVSASRPMPQTATRVREPVEGTATRA